MIRRPRRSPPFPSTTLFRSVCAKHQRKLATAIKRARIIGLLPFVTARSEEHTSELQSQFHLLFRLFFFNDPPTTEISPLPLHDALPICLRQTPEKTGDSHQKSQNNRASSVRYR